MNEETQEVELSGRVFVMTPLNLVELQVLEKIGKDMQAQVITARDAILKTSELMHASIRRLKKEITLEEVQEHITYRNYPRALRALTQVSGMRGDSGEATPATESTGTASMESSSSAPVIVSSE